MNAQQNHQTHLQGLHQHKSIQENDVSRLGRYTLLVGDYCKDSPYMTIGPNHLIFGAAFIIFNLFTFTFQYFTNKEENTKAFFVILNVFTFALDILWLSAALVNPGIATEGHQQSGQVCKACKVQNQIQILVKNDRYHCNECGICIDRQVNHIKWIGCCIGKNNCVVFKFLLLAIILWGLTMLTIIPLAYNQ